MIIPLLNPREPQEVSYWIPFIGHALGFVKSQDRVLNYGCEYFKNTREPFAITLGRERLYILTSYHDVIAMIKNNTTLDYGRISAASDSVVMVWIPYMRRILSSWG